MKRIEVPGAVFLYGGELVRVIGVAEGRTVICEPVDATPCPTCGTIERVHLLEHSPQFQDNAEPVPTVVDA